ncbi:MAG: hypothetical protein ACOX18_10700 [Bacillota bacterium]|jgi:hypothetical protein
MIVLWILGVPLLLLLVLLCLPLVVRLTLQLDGRLQLQTDLRWTFWHQKRELSLGKQQKAARKSSQKDAGTKSDAQARRRSRSKPDKQPRAGRSRRFGRREFRRFWPLVKKYLPRFWRALHLRCRQADLHLEVSDPALMGWIYGAAGATGWPPAPARLNVSFTGTWRLQAQVQWTAVIFPIQWLALLIRLAWEKPLRQIWWPLLRRKLRRERG